MGIITDRTRMISRYLHERWRYGLPEIEGTDTDQALFLIDGVGGSQWCVAMVRIALRQSNNNMRTILFDWQTRLRIDIWSDLVRIHRNRRKAAELADIIRAFRHDNPNTQLNLFAISGGTGIAVFACEHLGAEEHFNTIILAAPALSPRYNLAPALKTTRRCYALISERDRFILGLGTKIFGTMDRKFCPAAGMVGFQTPDNLSEDDTRAYQRLTQIHWTPDFRNDGNNGGHAGWVDVNFLNKHLLPLLHQPDTDDTPARPSSPTCR